MCAASLFVAVPAALGAAPLPTGYAQVAERKLGTGLEHDTLTGRTPAEAVHVARLDRSAPFELRAVAANGGVGHGLERTSSICARVHCLAAVNGDFFGPHDVPLGGVVSLGRLLHGPLKGHPQLLLGNGTPSAGTLTLAATLVTTDLKSLHVDEINQALRPNTVALYTPAIGSSTGTPKGTTEVTLRTSSPVGPLVLSKTTVVTVGRSASRRGNAPVPADGAVLAASGSGVTRLADVLKRISNGAADDDALLRVDASSGAVESIGGGPMLVHHGVIVVPDVRNDFYLGRHPRTIVGWTKNGDILLVTVDGRQPGRSAGMTLVEAARLMLGLGANEAMNLDGGGSTTFVTNGHVVNTPSDKAVRRGRRTIVLGDVNTKDRILGYVERPVATALVVVPRSVAPSSDDTAFSALPSTQPIPASSVASTDLRSDPAGSEPAIVVPVKSSGSTLPLVATVLVMLAAAGAAMHRRVPRVTAPSISSALTS